MIYIPFRYFSRTQILIFEPFSFEWFVFLLILFNCSTSVCSWGEQHSVCSRWLILNSPYSTKRVAFLCVNIFVLKPTFEHFVSCCHWGARLTALPLRVAHITAAINYLMGNTEYISFSITDSLSPVKRIVAICCNCASLLCFGLSPSYKSPISRATSTVASAPSKLKRSGKYCVYVCILWHCLGMISGVQHKNTFIIG